MKKVEREAFVKGVKCLPHGALLAMEDPVWEQMVKYLGPVGVVLGNQVFCHVLEQMWEHDFEELAPPSTKSG